MKKLHLVPLLVCFVFITCSPVMVYTQNVGIGTTVPNTSALVDITSTNKGLLIPRMGTSAINSIGNPAKGLMVYDSVKNQLMVNMGAPASPNWQTIVANSGWGLNGNSGTNSGNQFIGNIDNQPLQFRINNTAAGELNPVTRNSFFGLRAGQGNTAGYSNVAFGVDALKLNTNRSNLVAIGDSALYNNGTAVSFSDVATGKYCCRIKVTLFQHNRC